MGQLHINADVWFISILFHVLMLLDLALFVLCNCFGIRYFSALSKYAVTDENYTILTVGLIQKSSYCSTGF